MSWLILERYINDLWSNFVTALSDERKSKLKNPMSWTIDHILESLNFANKIDSKTYIKLMNLKRIRNAFIHKGETIERKVAKEYLDFTLKIVQEEYVAHRVSKILPLKPPPF